MASISNLFNQTSQADPATEPHLSKTWQILTDRFGEVRSHFVEVEEKRRKREMIVDLIGGCKGQLENVLAVAGRRRITAGDEVGLGILRSCLGELEGVVEMVREI